MESWFVLWPFLQKQFSELKKCLLMSLGLCVGCSFFLKRPFPPPIHCSALLTLAEAVLQFFHPRPGKCPYWTFSEL